LRHRRRIHSQAVIKKNNTRTNISPHVKSSRKGFKFFIFTIFALAIIAGAYFLYQKYYPIIKEKMSIQTAEQSADPLRYETPPIPVEDKPDSKIEEEYTPIKTRIQVEVLNGCGEQGIAKILSDLLIKHNYDVVNRGNYIEKGKENFRVEQTRIIDQLNTSENLVRSKDLAHLIGVSISNIESFESPAPIADLTIIIGKDFKNLAVFKSDR